MDTIWNELNLKPINVIKPQQMQHNRKVLRSRHPVVQPPLAFWQQLKNYYFFLTSGKVISSE